MQPRLGLPSAAHQPQVRAPALHAKGRLEPCGRTRRRFMHDLRMQADSKPENGTSPQYDPTPAKGFAPSGDDPELWWVVKYEQRRKAMAEQAAQQQQQQQQQPVTSSAEGQQGSGTPSSQQGGGSDQSGTTAQGSGSAERQPVSKVAALLQLVQLSLVLAALLLWPAATQPAGIVCLRVWLLYAIYWVFFALGTVRRQLKYGKLTSRKADKQRSSLQDRLALIGFIVSVVLLHWLPVLRYTKLGIYPTHITLYEMLGFPAVAAALFINYRAAKDLGEAWDRIVAPKRLVTTGVYTHLQHPIYTSYMLLFFGSAMLLHSAPYALLFIAICCAYYMRRTALESKVLEQAFGDEYREWAAQIPRFLPFF